MPRIAKKVSSRIGLEQRLFAWLNSRWLTAGASCAGLLLLASVIILATNCASADDSVPARPRAVIDQKQYDFGTVIEGTKIVHDFEIKNRGDATLQIQRLIPSCGCTASTVSKDSIEPGGSAKVHVEFDTTGFSGDKVKTVHVLTSDQERAGFDLALRGRIDRELVIEPSRVVFDDLPKGAVGSASRTVRISVSKTSSSSITAIRAMSKNINVEQVESGGKSRSITVSLAGDLPLGELRDRIVVEVAGSKGVRSYNVPIYARILGDLRVEPASLSFGTLGDSAPLERAAKIENFGNRGITLKQITSDNPAVTASSVVIEPGRKFVVKVQVNPSLLKDKKELRAQLTIATDAGELPLVVYGIKPSARIAS